MTLEPFPEKLEHLIWDCTVEIGLAGSSELAGCGFWISPGKVLTCAHVIQPDKAYSLRWDNLQLPAASISRYPEEGNPGEYPFPDLALIEILGAPPPHPCARLNIRLRPFDRLYAPAFTRARPSGEPISGECEGTAPQPAPWIKFRQTNVGRGASGAPLLNVESRAVCGVVKRTRSLTAPFGGWASPISAFLKLRPDVAEENAAFHEADARWAEAVAQGPMSLL